MIYGTPQHSSTSVIAIGNSSASSEHFTSLFLAADVARATLVELLANDARVGLHIDCYYYRPAVMVGCVTVPRRTDQAVPSMNRLGTTE
jgi:hypothetical protein